MEWWSAAFLQYSRHAKGGVSSSNYREMATTLEESYERHKDRDLHAWGFNSPVTTDRGGNHGSVLIQDWETDTLFGAYPTATGVGTAGEIVEASDIVDYWHPLNYEGVTPDHQRGTYFGAKEKTQSMLVSMVSHDFEKETEELEDFDNYAITDEYLVESPETGVRGAVKRMREDETLEESTIDHMKSLEATIVDNYDGGFEKQVLMYGDYEDPRIAVGDFDDSFWEGVKHKEQTYTTEMVENQLAS